MKKVDSDVMEQLRALADPGFLTGDYIGADYSHDELPGGTGFPPEAVILASDTQQVSEILRICSSAGAPVTVRGAGTGQVGGSVAVKGGIVLSMKEMNRILALDEAEKTITVQPGVLLQDVKASAARCGLYYPPDPGEQTATIGGNAATNAAGPCAVKYGRTRDYVLDATFVRADGSICRLSEDPGNEAVLGSEGCLAVLTELKLRLVDKPGADAILLFPFMDVETAVKAAKTILAADFDPAVVELMDTDLVEFSANVTGTPVFPVEMDGERVGATLMVTLEADDDDAVMEKMEAIAEMAEELECLDILVGDTPTMKKSFWEAHGAFHTSMESGCKSAWEANVEIPIEHAFELVDFSKACAGENGMRALIHAHLGSGGMHIHLASDLARADSAAPAKAFFDAVYAKVEELGGDVRGEYGYGYAKSAWISQAERERFKALKAAFDPQGILNPGKITAS